MRERIYRVIDNPGCENKINDAYDVTIIIAVILSLIPLAFKQETTLLKVLDKAAMVVFIIDYILRWITADYKFNNHSVVSFIRYPISFMAIVDLLSILPSLSILSKGFKVLRVLRLLRALRVLRVLKLARYSKNLEIIADVLKASKEPLIAVGSLAVAYIIVSALIIFNVEPDTFNTFYDAIYWSCVSLTTIGYGDIYPVTDIGRFIMMLSSIFGIAVVALPAGVITASYMKVVDGESDEK